MPPPAVDDVGGRYKYKGELSGAYEGNSLRHWVKFLPSLRPPSALCLTSWLRWTITILATYTDVTSSRIYFRSCFIDYTLQFTFPSLMATF
jgi:hypothetical protein